MHEALISFARAAATPTPVEPDPNLVTPGPWGFVVIAFVGLAVILLVWDMMRRIRRGRVRADIQEELDAELRAAAGVEPAEPDDEATGSRDDDADDAPQR
jgi:flagellar biosynthesis/type III secretory pathway M-ring protein FliF/YscJ